jgi:hypothetical protein
MTQRAVPNFGENEKKASSVSFRLFDWLGSVRAEFFEGTEAELA